MGLIIYPQDIILQVLQMTEAREVQISLELSQNLSIDHMLKDIMAESYLYTPRGQECFMC